MLLVIIILSVCITLFFSLAYVLNAKPWRWEDLPGTALPANRGRQKWITRFVFILWVVFLAVHRFFILFFLADVAAGSQEPGANYILLFFDPWATLFIMLFIASFHALFGTYILPEESLGPVMMVLTVIIDAAIVYLLWKACRGAFIEKEKSRQGPL